MEKIVSEILGLLPKKIGEALSEEVDKYTASEGDTKYVDEIRLRKKHPASLTLGNGKNIALPVILDGNDIAETVGALTEQSFYSHYDKIKKGFFTLKNGCRVGVCGRALFGSDGTVTTGGDITSVSIRIARRIDGAADGIYDFLSKNRFKGGALFYGPPGCGKTSLLYDIAKRAAYGENPLRVAIIDERDEFSDRDGNDTGYSLSLIDILEGYPKSVGIEIATRTLSPELIICDEIGNEAEAGAILNMQNTGIPLLASAHSDSFTSLLRRPFIKSLYINAVFSKYIGIKRKNNVFSFDISDTEEL